MSGRVLVGCERSGVVRRALRRLGIDAWSNDLVPADDGSPYHIIGDVQEVIKDDWSAAILFPDCTYLTVSGLHWNKRRLERAAKTEAAIEFVERLWAHRERIGRMAIENPIGCLSTRSSLGKPTQIIQPHWFDADASKATCLWLHMLPKLLPTKPVAPRRINGKPRWGNQTDSGQNKLPPSEDRARQRAETYPGVADAMALWWKIELMEASHG